MLIIILSVIKKKLRGYEHVHNIFFPFPISLLFFSFLSSFLLLSIFLPSVLPRNPLINFVIQREIKENKEKLYNTTKDKIKLHNTTQHNTTQHSIPALPPVTSIYCLSDCCPQSAELLQYVLRPRF